VVKLQTVVAGFKANPRLTAGIAPAADLFAYAPGTDLNALLSQQQARGQAASAAE
jgi:hypothetical protein